MANDSIEIIIIITMSWQDQFVLSVEDEEILLWT